MEALIARHLPDGSWRVEKDGEYLPEVFSSWEEISAWWDGKREEGVYLDRFLLKNR